MKTSFTTSFLPKTEPEDIDYESPVKQELTDVEIKVEQPFSNNESRTNSILVEQLVKMESEKMGVKRKKHKKHKHHKCHHYKKHGTEGIFSVFNTILFKFVYFNTTLHGVHLCFNILLTRVFKHTIAWGIFVFNTLLF